MPAVDIWNHSNRISVSETLMPVCIGHLTSQLMPQDARIGELRLSAFKGMQVCPTYAHPANT